MNPENNKPGLTLIPVKTTTLFQFFQFAHLPEHLQNISSPFFDLAMYLESQLPNNPEKTTAMRKLLEAKDCAVRAVLFEA